jgi:hypothetical protein
MQSQACNGPKYTDVLLGLITIITNWFIDFHIIQGILWDLLYCVVDCSGNKSLSGWH